MGKDLGTYFLEVLFENARGYIEEWNTGQRFSHGKAWASPVWATRCPPAWDSEADLIGTMIFKHTDNACDCNERQSIAYAHQEEDWDDSCGDELILKKLTLIRPNGETVVIYPEE